jgi:hypothetical protein
VADHGFCQLPLIHSHVFHSECRQRLAVDLNESERKRKKEGGRDVQTLSLSFSQ